MSPYEFIFKYRLYAIKTNTLAFAGVHGECYAAGYLKSLECPTQFNILTCIEKEQYEAIINSLIKDEKEYMRMTLEDSQRQLNAAYRAIGMNP
jgi:hypothetical protein